ncbi:MAG: ROK family protein [Clostridia bacterium]|nr:ROK family protein [Clostridia bacterium]
MYKIGIDLGGTNIAIGIVDNENKIISKVTISTLLPDTIGNIVGRTVDALKKCLAKADLTIKDISSIGIGTPGAVDSKNGTVIFANNLDFKNVPLAKMLSEKTGLKVYCENDANAAAYGEYLVDKNKSGTLVAITIGTGIGGGVIIGGNLYSGNKFSGGELGHMVINFDGIPCSCGRTGCYEMYASASALIRQTKEAMQQNLDSLMWQICSGNLDNVSGKTAFDGMRAGDETAKAVVEKYINYISIGLVDIINTFGPETICISGGVSNEGEYLLEPLRRHIELNSPINNQTTVKIAKLSNDAGIIGAANLDAISE